MSSTLGTRHSVQPTRPSHLTLRPGTPVLARSPGVLQVGLDRPFLRVPDDPATRSLLAALNRPGGVPRDPDLLPPASGRLLDDLQHAGLLVSLPDDQPLGDTRTVTLRAQFGADAARRVRAREEAVVAVWADPATNTVVAALLERHGLRRTTCDDLDASAHLLVTSGPLDREVADPLVRGSVPHLLVSGGAAGRRVGPFVEPGRTACLRCVDAHEALHDVRRPLLLAQAARAAREQPPPLDPVLDELALAWAVRDVARYVEGDEPSTWSTTVDIGPVAAPEVVRWGRHPECGCAWDGFTLLP